MRLLPRDERFFELFTSVAELNVRAAQVLLEMFQADETRRPQLVDSIKRCEHEADEITHAVVTRLDRTFITPLDREDIHMLASRLDDVLDIIDGTARRTSIFQPGPAPQGVILLAEAIGRVTQQLLVAVKVLQNGKAKVVINACIEVKRLEEEGDVIYHQWLARLFDGATDPFAVIKWKEIYDNLERTLDVAEDVSNVLESIAIKHS